MAEKRIGRDVLAGAENRVAIQVPGGATAVAERVDGYWHIPGVPEYAGQRWQHLRDVRFVLALPRCAHVHANGDRCCQKADQQLCGVWMCRFHREQYRVVMDGGEMRAMYDPRW